ncbi:MAG: thioesterase [Eubacteriales bacterium]|nr:thioesterase [Eubacteriales bacterium]
MIYKAKFKIGLEDLDINNMASNNKILAIMEDIAGEHSESLGFGVNDIETSRKGWVILDWKVKIIKRPAYNEIIEARTWSRKCEKLFAYRDYELVNEKGEVVVIGSSRWILMDIDKRRPMMLTEDVDKLYEPEKDKMVFQEEIGKLNIPVLSDEPFMQFTPQRRDLDYNGHMHNISYLKLAYEVIPEDMYLGTQFNNIRIEYKKEILKGDNVIINCQSDNNKCITTFSTGGKLNAVVQLDNEEML